MKLFELLTQSFTSFQRENELELAYLFGQKIDEIEYMKLKKPKYSGLFLRIAIFFYTVIRSYTFSPKKKSPKDVYIFAGTDNQFNSLKPTIEGLKNTRISFHLTIGQGLSNINNSQQSVNIIKYDIKNAIAGCVIFLLRAYPLYRKLKYKKSDIEISWYFDIFCQSYVFVPYFLDKLDNIQPSLVVMSNDHNVNTRSLRLAAEMLDIKTLYMQHASVSEIFPPLEFDYALLDGMVAYQTYVDCYELQKDANERIEKNVGKCQVLLTGQKKLVVQNAEQNESERVCVGLAVNQIDDFHCVQAILDRLSSMSLICIVRTHPYQNTDFLQQLHSYSHGKAWLTLSDPRKQPLADYFANLDALIAGNSSIHLEAALTGTATLYYEMSDEVHRPDYYGYVKNGVSLPLDREFTSKSLSLAIVNSDNIERHKAIKNYSATYDTRWVNKEGDLSAWIIKQILSQNDFSERFICECVPNYKTLCQIP
jgi:hypothetical protein